MKNRHYNVPARTDLRATQYMNSARLRVGQHLPGSHPYTGKANGCSKCGRMTYVGRQYTIEEMGRFR